MLCKAGKKLKEGWTKFLDKMKSKKAKKKQLKKKEQELMFKALEQQSPASLVEERGACASEGSIRSETDSESVREQDACSGFHLISSTGKRN